MQNSKSKIQNSTECASSYGQILKSSSIIGGSAAINLVIGMVAAKSGAIFLGPEGVGIAKLYQTVIGLVRTISSLGISSSGVREVAVAAETGDDETIGRTIKLLRKACWATGFLGWLIASLFCWPLSRWVFNDSSHALSIALLGGTVLFGAISGGQTALLQGSRRIGDLAKINVFSAFAGVAASVPLYWCLGIAGIVPSVVASAILSLLLSWYFARKVLVPDSAAISWYDAARQSRQLIGLGVAQMWSGLMSTLAATATAALIVRWFGMEANGIYGAAWALSGFFANFILSAMSADFYPRLTAAQTDHFRMNQLVNEQTEVGLLLALPGIVASLFFAPLAIKLFYTHEFLAAADLLPWFLLGVLGRVISWPMGFILLAKGESKWFAGSETFFTTLGLGLAIGGMHCIGLTGVGVAFFLLYILYTAAMTAITHHLTGHIWASPVVKLVIFTALICIFSVTAIKTLPSDGSIAAGIVATLASSIYCVRGLAQRLGHDNNIVRMACRFPGARVLLGL